MSYDEETIIKLCAERGDVCKKLQGLMEKHIIQSESLSCTNTSEYIKYGIGRRLSILKHSLNTIFDVFSPTAKFPLETNDRNTAEVALHAFVINIYGLFDNWAWAFLKRHKIDLSPRDVGMFSKKTKIHFPSKIKSYLESDKIKRWYNEYLKNYRDAVAHRIPLYIPPFYSSPSDGLRYNELEREMLESLKANNLQRCEEIEREQEALTKPCFAFLHSFSEGQSLKPVSLHPQLICDAMTVLEFGEIFLKNWHERAIVPPKETLSDWEI